MDDIERGAQGVSDALRVILDFDRQMHLSRQDDTLGWRGQYLKNYVAALVEFGRACAAQSKDANDGKDI